MQIQNIVVPLDGSRLAEQALPYACAIARRSGATLRVVLVLPGVNVIHPADAPGLGLEALRQAMDDRSRYLDDVLARIRREGYVRVTGEVRIDAPVDGILKTISQDCAELVTITTHARGGFRRAWAGSVADELMRRTDAPLLVLKSSDDARADLTREPAADAVVVPLDGSWLAEAALEPAVAFATLFGLPIKLLRLVSGPLSLSPWAIVPPESASDLRDEAAGAEIYLAEVADRLRNRGVQVCAVVLHDDSVASAIVACGTGAITVMATHGFGGVKRILLGSVTDRVVRMSDWPVVVVRPLHEPAGTREEMLLDELLPTYTTVGG